MAKAKRRRQEVGFSSCTVADVQFDDPGATLVVEAEKLGDTDGRRVLLSFDSIQDFVNLANNVMDFLSDQEDVRINVGAEERPR